MTIKTSQAYEVRILNARWAEGLLPGPAALDRFAKAGENLYG